MKPADVSGMPKELEEVRRIALGEVPANEAQVRAALAQAWAWLAPLTSALPSVGPSSSVPKYATGDVERWFQAVVARTNGSTETVMARMLRDAALKGAKVPGLMADNAALVDALKELADLMEGVRDGSYTPDSFTLQVAHRLLAEEHPGAALLADHEAKVSALTNRATLAEEQRTQTHQQVEEIAKVLDPEVTPDAWGCHEAAQKRMREISALQARVAELERERDNLKDCERGAGDVAAEALAAQRKAESERDAAQAQVAELERKVLVLQEGRNNVRVVRDRLRAERDALRAQVDAVADIHRMLSPLDVRPAVPPLLPVSERIQQSLAKLGHEPTPLTTSAADALHPSGRCTCTGEGTCAWCRARCDACGSPYIPEAVRHSLAQVWSALRITTAHQGVAVAVLRAVYPELPVPNARAGADILPAWNALAQAVTEAARLGAEDMRNQAARHIAGLVLAGQDPFSFARELDALPLLPGEEVPRG
ncbi:hypothetical protein D7Y15_08060 [Corallococcus sp. AB030]|uniref:hypothetical protein n=1 Tax=Corallococcus sp. AB030 TaxID=2316716 RepID=UPI000ECD61CB|nr:hypothetical protein [Corallococcus sp. AB030]RKI18642.1 hypothetical protein D7Y15_08060 [Corallococcus sp. AB030]